MISAVLQTSFLGDLILTTPLLARLGAEGEVHVVATPANAIEPAHVTAAVLTLSIEKRA